MPETNIFPVRQAHAPDTPPVTRPLEARAPPTAQPPMLRSPEDSGGAQDPPRDAHEPVRPPVEGFVAAPVMPRPVPTPPAAPAIPVPAVPNVRGSPVQLPRPTIWDLTHSQVCHYRLQRGAQLERLLRNLTQLLDG